MPYPQSRFPSRRVQTPKVSSIGTKNAILGSDYSYNFQWNLEVCCSYLWDRAESHSTTFAGTPPTCLTLLTTMLTPAEWRKHCTTGEALHWPYIANYMFTTMDNRHKWAGKSAKNRQTRHLKLFLASSSLELITMVRLDPLPKTSTGNQFKVNIKYHNSTLTGALLTTRMSMKHIMSIFYDHSIVP